MVIPYLPVYTSPSISTLGLHETMRNKRRMNCRIVNCFDQNSQTTHLSCGKAIDLDSPHSVRCVASPAPVRTRCCVQMHSASRFSCQFLETAVSMFGENFVAAMFLLLLFMFPARDIPVSPSGFALETSSGMLRYYDCN